SFRCSCDKRFVAQPVEVPQENLVRLQSLSRSDNDAGAFSVEVDDIKRLARSDADAAPLTDRIVQDTFMTTEHAAINVDDVTRIGRGRLKLGDDIRIFALRHEADV